MRNTKIAVAVLLMSLSVTSMGAQKEKPFSKPVSVSVTIVSAKAEHSKGHDIAVGLVVSPLLTGKRGYEAEITYPDGHKTTAFLIQDGTAPLNIQHTYQATRKKDYISIETDRPDPRNPSKNRIDAYPIRDEVPQS